MGKLSRGNLFKCIKDVAANPTSSTENRRKLLVETGEIVEFRYPVNANFRTTSEEYLNLDEGVFLECFEHYGVILPDVERLAKCVPLKIILEHSLFRRA